MSIVDHSVCEARQGVFERALPHILRCIHNAPLENDPFPHAAFYDLFPHDIYAEMLRRLPATGHYTKFGGEEKNGKQGYQNRYHFKLTEREASSLDGESAAFWLGVRDAIGSRELVAALRNKFADALAFRFGVSREEALNMEGYPLPELFRETAGYSIKPHPDTRKKLITMQISLAADDSQSDLGTAFYRMTLKPKAWFSGEFRGFEEVKRMPFAPNTAYAFCVLNTLTKKSWHGREQLRENCGVRNTILNIVYAKAEHGNQDLVEQYRRAA